jgi:hypothetical protein
MWAVGGTPASSCPTISYSGFWEGCASTQNPQKSKHKKVSYFHTLFCNLLPAPSHSLSSPTPPCHPSQLSPFRPLPFAIQKLQIQSPLFYFYVHSHTIHHPHPKNQKYAFQERDF